MMIFFSLLLAYLPLMSYVCKSKGARNLHNFIMFMAIIADYFIRLGMMIYTVFFDDNKPFEVDGLPFYFAFQLPFDLLHIGIVAHYFQWKEGAEAFKSPEEEGTSLVSNDTSPRINDSVVSSNH